MVSEDKTVELWNESFERAWDNKWKLEVKLVDKYSHKEQEYKSINSNQWRNGNLCIIRYAWP